MRDFAYRAPRTLEEALQALARPGAMAKAGGVDLVPLLQEGLVAPDTIIHLGDLPDLDRIETKPDGAAVIGPLVTLATIAAHPVLARTHPSLVAAAAGAATPQIREQATIGGNLVQRPRCWYFRSPLFDCRKKGGSVCFAETGENRYHALFDAGSCRIVHPSSTATALVAAQATLTLEKTGGRRDVLVEEFLTVPGGDVSRENTRAPDELITAIRLPAADARDRHAYMKVRERQAFDWPIAEIAVVLRMAGTVPGAAVERARIVLGAAAPRPWRVPAAESLLVGKGVTVAQARAVAAAMMAGASPLADNGWRVGVFRALIRRALLAAAGVPDPSLATIGGAAARA